jgi:hypothetical protein
MKHGATCPIHKQDGSLLNGNHRHQLEAENLEWIGVVEVLFDCQDIIYYEFSLRGKTVNKEVYTDILLRLRDAVRRKRPHKWRTDIWFLLTTVL